MARDSASSAAAPGADGKKKKTRWYHQILQAYKITRQADPAVTWWMLLAFVVVVSIGVTIGLVSGQLVYFTLIGIPFALIAAMYVLARRAEASAYGRIEGKPGAALSALRSIRRGWDFPEEPIAIDPRTQDMVFRGVGRAGVVLVGEGPPHRASRLLENERKKTARVLPGVPVILIQCGNAEGQVPLRKLARKVQRLKPKLTKNEAAEVNKRLRALGGVRLPVPKGIDPYRVRPDRKGTRGR